MNTAQELKVRNFGRHNNRELGHIGVIMPKTRQLRMNVIKNMKSLTESIKTLLSKWATRSNQSEDERPRRVHVSPNRPSTHKSLTPSLSTSTTSPASTGRVLSSTPRTVGSNSRPSSPSLRVRPTPQPINHTNFPYETPPNLRTSLPDRPFSAGRSRPGGSTTAKGNLESSNTGGSITRRHSSPIVNRGRVAEPPGRGRPHVNGHTAESLDPRRTSYLPDSLKWKPIKSSSQDNVVGGFGSKILKKSLDMAIKHMDIRNEGPRSVVDGPISNEITSENGSYNNVYSWNRGLSVKYESPLSSKLSSKVDIYKSSRYDAILLKEDFKNTSWLHSVDDKIDEGSFFDNGFELLPEPFGPL
ncbi:hypothetical protein Tco_0120849 [Tanacetum coccineum]